MAGAPDTAEALIADDAGFVSAGFIGGMPGETCGDPRPFQAETWTSTDGRAWRQMPTDPSFERAHLTSLFRDGRTLTGVGLEHDHLSRFEPVAWAADLPTPSDDDAAPSAPSPTEQGCGD